MDMEKYVEENYSCMDRDDPMYVKYEEAVVAKESAEIEMYEAIKKYMKTSCDVSLIEIKMAYRQGLKAGIGLYNLQKMPNK